jgi:hypothetical protein
MKRKRPLELLLRGGWRVQAFVMPSVLWPPLPPLHVWTTRNGREAWPAACGAQGSRPVKVDKRGRGRRLSPAALLSAYNLRAIITQHPLTHAPFSHHTLSPLNRGLSFAGTEQGEEQLGPPARRVEEEEEEAVSTTTIPPKRSAAVVLPSA